MANRTEPRDTATSESTYRSVAALAADIGLSERSTRSALRRGEIPHIRIGHRFILPRAAIAEWLRLAGQSRETDAVAHPVALFPHSGKTGRPA
jgi:excisionase family DNA binding protein